MEEKDMQSSEAISPAPAEGEAPKARRAPAKRKKVSDPSVEAEAKAAAMPFEAAAARLEEIVKALEGGTLSLEESLSLYEEGVALVRRCTGELDQAKQRVMALRRRADGTVEAAAFTTPEDS
ncbi:MAG: exodeoxyribonuclease VII small subunit [Eubacteriales bacterium]